MQNRAKKRASCSTCHAKKKHVMRQTSCSTCYAKKQAVPYVMQKNKLFHMSCKNYAKTMQNAARTERQPAEPSLSPGCYMCYMCYITRQATEHLLSPGSLLCYISQGKPLNIHSPRVPCYMCYICYISQGKSLNIHSSRVPCYMCYMCYMAPILHI